MQYRFILKISFSKELSRFLTISLKFLSSESQQHSRTIIFCSETKRLMELCPNNFRLSSALFKALSGASLLNHLLLALMCPAKYPSMVAIGWFFINYARV